MCLGSTPERASAVCAVAKVHQSADAWAHMSAHAGGAGLPAKDEPRAGGPARPEGGASLGAAGKAELAATRGGEQMRPKGGHERGPEGGQERVAEAGQAQGETGPHVSERRTMTKAERRELQERQKAAKAAAKRACTLVKPFPEYEGPALTLRVCMRAPSWELQSNERPQGNPGRCAPQTRALS